MAAGSEQASKHTRARAQCSNASVGLAQARPNNLRRFYPPKHCDKARALAQTTYCLLI